MSDVVAESIKMTAEGALLLLHSAMKKALGMKQPQCIAVVDDGCNLLAFLRMDGARLLSDKAVMRKAKTAVTRGGPTGSMDPTLAINMAFATDGEVSNLQGGLPVIVKGRIIGAIGVGSGTGDQDAEVAAYAVSCFPDAQTFG